MMIRFRQSHITELNNAHAEGLVKPVRRNGQTYPLGDVLANELTKPVAERNQSILTRAGKALAALRSKR